MRRVCNRCTPPSPPTATAVLTTSLRTVSQPIDRTRNERIEDRQSSFHWHERHTFRPHKVHTYDPCDWGRRLQRTALKHRGMLGISQRLRSLEEREEERRANIKARAEWTASTSSDVPCEAKEEDVVAAHAAFVERVVSQMVSARTSHHAATCRLMTTRDVLRITTRRADALLAAFSLVAAHSATGQRPNDESPRLTYEVLAVVWCELLRGAELLIEALQSHPELLPDATVDPSLSTSPRAKPPTEEEVVVSIYKLCVSTFTGMDQQRRERAYQHDVAPGNTCETLIEDVFVSTHPLMLRAPMLVMSAPDAQSSSSESVESMSERLRSLQRALTARAQAPHEVELHEGGKPLLQSKLHPDHLQLCWHLFRRVTSGGEMSRELSQVEIGEFHQTLVHLLLHEARGLWKVGCDGVAQVQGTAHRTRASLRSPAVDSKLPFNHAVGPRAVPVPLEIHSSPQAGGGADRQRVQEDELDGLLSAVSLAIELTPLSASSSTSVSLSRALLHIVDLLSITPNYNIGLADVSPLTHGVVASGLLERSWFASIVQEHSASSNVRQGGGSMLHLRHDLLLLISRITLGGGTTGDLQRLLWSILELRLEEHAPTDTAAAADSVDGQNGGDDRTALLYRECRRLRGLALHELVNDALPMTAAIRTFAQPSGDDDDAGDGAMDHAVLLLLHLMGANTPMRKRTWGELVRAVQAEVPLGATMPSHVAALLLIARGLVRNPQQGSSAHATEGGGCILDEIELGTLASLAAIVAMDGQTTVQRGQLNLFTRNAELRDAALNHWAAIMDRAIPSAIDVAMQHPAAPMFEPKRLVKGLRGILWSVCDRYM